MKALTKRASAVLGQGPNATASLSALMVLSLTSVMAHAAPVTHNLSTTRPVVGAAIANSLIVRYREPQNNLWQATTSARGSTDLSTARAEILNSSEGVLKLAFDSAEDADRARSRLELSSEVLSVSPNLLYRPAIHYSMHASRFSQPSRTERDARDQGEGAQGTFLAVPFVSPTELLAGAPEVSLPPTSVTAGVDPMAARDWALASIRLPSQTEVESLVNSDSASSGAIVAAVIDTGIDYNHEDLSGGLWRNPDNSREVGYDFAHNNNKPYDVVHFDVEGCLNDFSCGMGIGQGEFLTNPGHGTHCAGHVGAVANNSVGIRGIGASKTQVMGLKFFYDAGEANAGQGDDAAAIKAIDYAITHGAKVISASWGGRQKRPAGEASEIKAALVRAQKAGVIVVIAAGNDGVDQDTVADPSYPAAYDLDNLIVVAATDKNDALAEFSSFGRKSVHIAAPGVKVLSTTAGSKYDDVVAHFKDSDGKAHELDWDGTSMATPIVAGAVALVWSKNPTANYHEIRDRILKSARPVAGLSGKVSSGGVLNVAAALGQ